MIIGMGWFFLCVVLLANMVNTKLGGIYFNDFLKYSYMGNSFSRITLFLITHQLHSIDIFMNNSMYLWQLFAPTMFISILGVIEIIPAVVVIWINLLSNYKPAHTIFFQYTAFIIPFIWLGTVKGISFLANKFGSLGKSAAYITKVVIPVLLLISSAGMFYRWMLPTIEYKWSMNNKLSHTIEDAITHIPKRYTLLGTGFIVSHLSQRQYVYDIDTISSERLKEQGIKIMLKQIPAYEPMYIILAPKMAQLFSQEAKGSEDTLLKMLLDNKINPIYSKDGIFVFRILHGSTFTTMVKDKLHIN